MKVKLLVICLASLLFANCDNSPQGRSNIPNVPVNLTINLDLPLYQDLSFIGQYVYENGGNKGIVIVHHTDGNYYAFDRTCTYEPLDDCNLIEMNESNTRLRCGKTTNNVFSPCCGSQFFVSGGVLQGPAVYPLRNYRVTKTGSYLYITN